MTLLAAFLLAAAPAAALPLKIVSVGHELVFDAPGSPREPYAMEFIRLRLRMINVASEPIGARDLAAEMPALQARDFVIDHDRAYVVDGRAFSGDLAPEGVIELWVDGHFSSSGAKRVTLDTGADSLTTMVEVRPDPGCYDSDGGAEIHSRGWTIGQAACVDQAKCGTSTRMADLCEGDRLREFYCRPQSGVSVMTLDERPCPNGCADGACLPDPDPGRGLRWAKLVFPASGEKFRPGEKITVVWESKGVPEVRFALHSTNVHQLGGEYLFDLGKLPAKETPSFSRNVGTLALPRSAAPATDWTLLLAPGDSQPGVADLTGSPFTIEGFPGQASGTPPKPNGLTGPAAPADQPRVPPDDPWVYWLLAGAGGLGGGLLWRFGVRAARGVRLHRQAQRLDLGYERDGQRLWGEELARLPCLAAGRGRPIEHLLTHSISGSWKHAFDHAGQTIVLFPLRPPAKASRRSAGRWRLESEGAWLAAFRPGTLARPDQLAAFLDEAEAVVKKP